MTNAARDLSDNDPTSRPTTDELLAGILAKLTSIEVRLSHIETTLNHTRTCRFDPGQQCMMTFGPGVYPGGGGGRG